MASALSEKTNLAPSLNILKYLQNLHKDKHTFRNWHSFFTLALKMFSA
jgi:hypothetical protein